MEDRFDIFRRWASAARGVVTYFPDYRRANPYQDLLYRDVPGFHPQPGTIADARQRLLSSAGRSRVFHLHWTTPILDLAADRETAIGRMAAFLEELLAFLAEGGRLVWTIHNVLPHECQHRDIEIELRTRLCELADFIHIHGPQVVAIAAPCYTIPRHKTLIGRHGSYLGVYLRGATRVDARQQFGFTDEMTVLLFMGQIRGYKGLDQLVSAYRTLKSRDPKLRLIIAGQAVMMPPAAIEALAQIDSGIRFELRRIADEELQVFFAASDVAVLPYSTMLTSGSAYLALSFGTPVIAPRVGLLSEAIEDGYNGLLYPVADQFHLELALHRYLDLSAEARARLRQGATASAARLDWKEAGLALTTAFIAAANGKSACEITPPRPMEQHSWPERSGQPQNRPRLDCAPPLRIRIKTEPEQEAAVDWWRPGKGGENFGDFLSLLLWESLFAGIRIEASIYHVIGSVIQTGRIRREIVATGRLHPGPIVFWGCGCRSSERLDSDVLSRSVFCGVRGPLTRDVLELPMDTPMGDTGLLLPLIYQPRTNLSTRGRTVCVPHINDIATPERLMSVTGADYVLSPNIEGSIEALKVMIDSICSANFVLAGSLHAAIVACAYDVPFSYFDAGHRDIPFKWDDFSASVKIGAYFARDVREGWTIHRTKIAPNLQRPPLAGLLGCAPFWVKPEPLEKARLHWGNQARDTDANINGR